MNFPNLSNSISNSLNRMNYTRLTNQDPFKTDWLGAEQRMQGMGFGSGQPPTTSPQPLSMDQA